MIRLCFRNCQQSPEHFLDANSRKEASYGPLISDLEHTGFFMLEVGCLVHLLPPTVSKLCNICYLQKHCVQAIFKQAAQVAISCSYKIFNALTSELCDVTEFIAVCLVTDYCMYVLMYFFVLPGIHPAICVSASLVPVCLNPFPFFC